MNILKFEKSEKLKFINRLGYHLSVGFLCLMLGIIISAQSKKHLGFENTGIITAKRLNELILLLKETKNKNTNLEKELTILKNQFKKIDNDNSYINSASPYLKKVLEASGLTAVSGAGITITLDDSKNTNNADLNYNYNNLVNSDDLLKIINELKASGVKAISINNQRIVTTTEIITAGNFIVVNQTKLFPPYIINAVGPPDIMITTLKMRGGIFEYLNVFGIKLDVKKNEKLTVPAYKGDL